VICGDVLPFLEHPEEAALLDKDPILGLLKWICDATENSFNYSRQDDVQA
jgi:hypothetical protein